MRSIILLLYANFCFFQSCVPADGSSDNQQITQAPDIPELSPREKKTIKMQALKVDIEQNIRMSKQMAGQSIRALMHQEGYVKLHFQGAECNINRLDNLNTVSLKLSKEDCFETTPGSKLYELNQIYALYRGNKDVRGYGTNIGLKVPGVQVFKSAMVMDSVGNLSMPYNLRYNYVVDTIDRYDTTYIYSNEEEGFNAEQNGEIAIDTIILFDTIYTVYEDIQVIMGDLAKIENELVRSSGKVKSNLKMDKQRLKKSISEFHMHRKDAIGELAKLLADLDHVKIELIKLQKGINNDDELINILKG